MGIAREAAGVKPANPRSSPLRSRASHLLVAVSALAAVSTGAFGQQPSIVGAWEWTRKANNCSEQYSFRDDGTLSIKSGEDRRESTYLMSWAPESNGRFKLTLSTVKDSGGPGCADPGRGRPAQQRVVYVLFGGSRETMILCESLDGADCIGPLKRNAR